MAWHMGYPLSQSLFTSYHIDQILWPNPKTLDKAKFDRHGEARLASTWLHVVYRAYCLAVIKCCDYVHRRIGAEHYYEVCSQNKAQLIAAPQSYVNVTQEEDFVSNLYNRNFLSHFNEAGIQKLLDEALGYTERQASIEEATRYAIVTRLNLRRRMLDAVASDLDLSKNSQTQKWMQCTALLPKLRESRPVAKPVKEAFSIKIQRRMASSVPPRPMVDIDFEDAHTFLRHLCRDAADVYNVIEYHGSSNILVCGLDYSLERLLKKFPEFCVYISIAETSAINLYTLFATIPNFPRYENPRHRHNYKTDFRRFGGAGFTGRYPLGSCKWRCRGST